MLRREVIINVILFVASAFVFLSSAVPVIAVPEDGGSAPVSSELKKQVFGQLGAGASEEEAPIDPRLLVARVIQALLVALGIIFTILLLLSGYWFFTAKGEEEKITKAKDTARRAVIGLIIIMVAYSVTSYIVGALQGIREQGEAFFPPERGRP